MSAVENKDLGVAAGAAPIDQAAKAIAEGRASAFALWVLLGDENERDGFALKPMPWEGPGEYQHVKFNDGREGFVRIPLGRSLPTSSRSKVRVRTTESRSDNDLLGALDLIASRIKDHGKLAASPETLKEWAAVIDRAISSRRSEVG